MCNGLEKDRPLWCNKSVPSCVARDGWDNDGNGTDDYGFSALPAGYRRASDGAYLVKGTSSSWWNANQYTSTADYIRMLSSSNSTEISSNVKVNGNPVRCIKN